MCPNPAPDPRGVSFFIANASTQCKTPPRACEGGVVACTRISHARAKSAIILLLTHPIWALFTNTVPSTIHHGLVWTLKMFRICLVFCYCWRFVVTDTFPFFLHFLLFLITVIMTKFWFRHPANSCTLCVASKSVQKWKTQTSTDKKERKKKQKINCHRKYTINKDINKQNNLPNEYMWFIN